MTWLLDLQGVVMRLPNRFTLADVYAHKTELAAKHPENKNVEAKLRQALQQLRDLGIIRFTGKGTYELTKEYGGRRSK